MAKEKKEVLVAILTGPENLEIAKKKHWYHIRKSPVERRLKKHWPPKWIAFYQPKSFEVNKWRIEYYAPVRCEEPQLVQRLELFPKEPDHKRAQEYYYKVHLGPVEKLPAPIIENRGRYLDFIQTTCEKLLGATEINDLYDDSYLEDKLWKELKKRNISATRQHYVGIGKGKSGYRLDFAIFCKEGWIAVETDGREHSKPERIENDIMRSNELAVNKWHMIRFNAKQVNDEMEKYCVDLIERAINNFGGTVDEQSELPLHEGDEENQTPY